MVGDASSLESTRRTIKYTVYLYAHTHTPHTRARAPRACVFTAHTPQRGQSVLCVTIIVVRRYVGRGDTDLRA